MKGQCLIPGCRHLADGHLCTDHWLALPMPVRRRWWAETEYGKNEPSEELRAALIEAIDGGGDGHQS